MGPKGFQNNDAAHDNYQYLEDLATAYWYSEMLFSALELKLFQHLAAGHGNLARLAHTADCHEESLFRLLRGLQKMALVDRYDGQWFNTQVTDRFLVPGKPDYMGEFFLYRRYMQPNWSQLTRQLSRPSPKAADPSPEAAAPPPDPPAATTDYQERNHRYVTAMDTLVRQKAREIAALLKPESLKGPILDVGGGAGAMIRALMPRVHPKNAVLFELPEVIAAARTLYPDPSHWQGIDTLAGDFRTHRFHQRFGVVVLSNFLHAYGPDEAAELLAKAVSLVEPNGVLVIHDYFPDRDGKVPGKGALYDVTMMLNTYNGQCHTTQKIKTWLSRAGMATCQLVDLDTDTTVMVAGNTDNTLGSMEKKWVHTAQSHGFRRAVVLSPSSVVTAPWVRAKCRWGCAGFGKNLQCPPRGMDHRETREMLDNYETLILLEGAPPGKTFHENLLALERAAFLEGFHKAFVFGAGPCPLCPSCPTDGTCRHPECARPAMEASGIDVYATASRAGMPLKPVADPGGYIKYMGLLLLV